MTGLIYDIKRFAVHDGPGIRTTVFFKGCPLNCTWCHNPESRSGNIQQWVKKKSLNGKTIESIEEIGKWYTPKELFRILEKDQMSWEESGGGITFSGGEPLIQIDFLVELLRMARNAGIHTTVDSCGYADKLIFDKITPFTDLFLFDLKHHDSRKHKEQTGVENVKILENLNHLLSQNHNVWVRIPIIPGYNDSVADQNDFIKLLKTMNRKPEQVNLLPFHSIANHKYNQLGLAVHWKGKPTVAKSTLITFTGLYEAAGYKTIIGG